MVDVHLLPLRLRIRLDSFHMAFDFVLFGDSHFPPNNGPLACLILHFISSINIGGIIGNLFLGGLEANYCGESGGWGPFMKKCNCCMNDLVAGGSNLLRSHRLSRHRLCIATIAPSHLQLQTFRISS